MATNNSINSANPIPVAKGGTGLASGTSGGIPYFSASNAISSSAALGLNQLVCGGGAGSSPTSSSTFTYDASTARALISSSAIQSGVTITSSNTSSGTESFLNVDRGSLANGYAQLHFLSAGTEDWAIGTRANSQAFTFFNTSASFAPYSFSKLTTKYDLTISSNVTGSLNESSLTLSRGDLANGYATLYFKTPGNDSWIIQLQPGTTNLCFYHTSIGSNALTVKPNSGNFFLSQPHTVFTDATSTGTQSNVTGGGATYTVICGNEVSDQTGSYNPVTGIFTVPTGGDGVYEHVASIGLQNIDAGHTSYAHSFLCAGTSYVCQQGNAAAEATGGQLTRPMTMRKYMTAGQTCQVQTTVSGGTATVGILNSNHTSFSSTFIC